ncbi:MAG: serine/threonine protein kinase [Armatimonadetes bacterium]|nr:serine/threonine protein kinase [Armatimonadota bacterium]
MGRLRGMVLLLLALIGPAAAQPPADPRWIVFQCAPSDAEVFLQNPGLDPIRLGRAHVPVAVDPRWLQEGSRLLFRRDGWRDGVVELRPTVGDRFPDPPARLEPLPDPASRLAQLGYYLARPVSWLGIAAGAGLGLWLWRSRGRRRSDLEKRRQELAVGLPRDPLSGSSLGGYLLLERLASGGTSTVYRALPELTLEAGDEVAVKVMDRALGAEPAYRLRWKREVEICSRLCHPNLVRIHAAAEEDGLLFLVMERLTGSTLEDRIVPEGLPWQEALATMLPAFDALALAHRHGVVHRDIKPQNFFITREGCLKLLDFGVARGEEQTQATATGVAVGSPTYMAPEQVNGSFGPHSDQYALGIVLYELLTGSPPFTQADPVELALVRTRKPAPPLRGRKPDLPPSVESAIMRMLARLPAKRYATMEEARDALGSCIQGL